MAHARTERLVGGLELAIGIVAAGTAAVGAPRSVATGWTVAAASVAAGGASGGGWRLPSTPAAWARWGRPVAKLRLSLAFQGADIRLWRLRLWWLRLRRLGFWSPAGMNTSTISELAREGDWRNPPERQQTGGIFSSAGFGNLKSTSDRWDAQAPDLSAPFRPALPSRA